MRRLTRDGTAEPVPRDQVIRRERGQGNIHFPCSADDHDQGWQPYPADPYPCYMWWPYINTYINGVLLPTKFCFWFCCLRKIWTHLDLLSIPQSGGEMSKRLEITHCRWASTSSVTNPNPTKKFCYSRLLWYSNEGSFFPSLPDSRLLIRYFIAIQVQHSEVPRNPLTRWDWVRSRQTGFFSLKN